MSSNVSWAKSELSSLKTIGPYLLHRETAEILNKCFGSNRTFRSVRDQMYRKGFQNKDKNPPAAIEAAQKSKSLSKGVKQSLVAAIQTIGADVILPPSTSTHTKTEMRVEGNYAHLERTLDRSPRTLEDLLELCEVDQTIWKVEDYKINSYEQGSKLDGEITITPLFQIKARLVRSEPIICQWPAVSPIIMKSFPLPKKKKSTGGIKKALVIPDSQNGYRRDMKTGYLDPTHDRLAWDLVCQIAEQERPDIIVLLGDMLDLPDWSDKFLVTPDLYATTQPALFELHWWIQRLVKTGAEIKYLAGNHEERMRRAIIRNTVAAYQIRPANAPKDPPVVSIESFLGLRDLGVEYIEPYGFSDYWINENLRVSHGDIVRAQSGKTAEAVVRNARCSEIFGHTHRIECATKTVWEHKGPKQYMAASPGTLARLEPGIVPAVKGRNNWQQGFAFVGFEEGNGLFDVRLAQIIKGRAVFNGRMWEGQDQIERIAKDVDWEALLPVELR